MRIGRMAACMLMLLPAACGQSTTPANDAATRHSPVHDVAAPTPARPAGATPIGDAQVNDPRPRSCSAELGSAAAARRVAICRNVSPATHPPCNAANSCALIDDEIARSCSLFARDGAPMTGCRADPNGAEAAADVVRRYYSAINASDYATAWSQWGDDGRPGQTFAAFQRGFARTRSTHASIGALPPSEGAAGSLYQSVPVTVEATLDDGTRQRFTGTYVVRRVNDIDGATPSQLRWHIDSAKLAQAR